MIAYRCGDQGTPIRLCVWRACAIAVRDDPKAPDRCARIPVLLSRATRPHFWRDTGQRYIHNAKRGCNVMLFVRSSNKDAYGRTPPFIFLGPGVYQSHQGERPMAIVWRLHRPMPLDVFAVARVAAG